MYRICTCKRYQRENGLQLVFRGVYLHEYDCNFQIRSISTKHDMYRHLDWFSATWNIGQVIVKYQMWSLKSVPLNWVFLKLIWLLAQDGGYLAFRVQRQTLIFFYMVNLVKKKLRFIKYVWLPSHVLLKCTCTEQCTINRNKQEYHSIV